MAIEYQEIKVGNEILRFPIDMSDEDIAKTIQGDSDIQAQLADDAVEYEEGLYIGKMKQGLTSGFSFVEAIAENPLWEKVSESLMTGGGSASTINPKGLDAPGAMKEVGTAFTEDFRENEMEWADRTADFFGWDKVDMNLLPKDQIEATLAAGAQMMTDPLVAVSKAKNVSEFLLKIPFSMAQ